MATKLTLRLDDALVNRVKHYAVGNKTSLSRLVDNFFRSLVPVGKKSYPIRGVVAKLTGILPEKINLTALKREYRERLSRKHG